MRGAEYLTKALKNAKWGCKNMKKIRGGQQWYNFLVLYSLSNSSGL